MLPISDTRRTALICAVLCAVTLAVFWPVVHHAFVNYDDTAYVTENPQVLAGVTPAGIAWAFREGHFANWHPLTWLSHMLDVQLFGLRAGGHHFTSLLLHLANTVLLFLLLKRMTARVWPSAAVAALFALHPLHVESVAWVSDRKDLLSTFFCLLCLGAYVRYVEQSNVSRFTFHVSPSYLLSLALFALALMSKAIAVTLPAVMLLLDYWPLGRLSRPAPGQSPPETRNPNSATFRQLLTEKVPFFILAVVGTVLGVIFLKQAGATNDAPNVGLGERLTRMAVSYQHYLAKLIWPSGLVVPYLRPTHWPLWELISATAIVVVITVATLGLARRHPQLPVGWFWFLATLVPVVGMVPVGAHIFADRYSYFPLIGLFIAVVWTVADLSASWPQRMRVLGGVAAAAMLGFAIASILQLRYWRDSEALFRHTIKIRPDNYFAHNGLGLYLAAQRRTDEAISEYRTAVKLNPLYDDAYSNLALALAERGNYQEAAMLFDTALHLKPHDVKSLNNFGDVLILLGRNEQAILQFQHLLRLQPDNARAHNNLAICWKKMGRTGEAITEYRAAIRLQPDFFVALNNLAWILAAGTDPKFRNGPEAVTLATRACELTSYQNPIPLATLAAAFAESGRFQEGLSLAQQAQDLVKGRPGVVTDRLAAMVKNFRAGRPYHAD